MLDDHGLGPFDFYVLSDQQPMIFARGNHQQAHQ
jgi:hypothetical protein